MGVREELSLRGYAYSLTPSGESNPGLPLLPPALDRLQYPLRCFDGLSVRVHVRMEHGCHKEHCREPGRWYW